MKEFRGRILFIAGAIALSLYLLWPTYSDYQNNKEIQDKLDSAKTAITANNPDISENRLENILTALEDSLIAVYPGYRETRDKRIKLGLDLQGGMYLVMEVNTARLLERLAKDPDPAFERILAESEKEAEQTADNIVSILTGKLQEEGIRLSRYFGSIREEDSEIISRLEEQETDAVTRAIEIISNRVNQYGVSEPSIQKQGARRIVIELPGIAKEEEAKRLLQGRALLEFKIVKDAEFSYPIMQQIDAVLAGTFNDTTETDTTDLTADNNVNTDETSTADNTEDIFGAGDDETTEPDSSILPEDDSEEAFAKDHPFFAIAQINPQSPYADAYVREKDRNKVENYLQREEIQKIIPDNVEFLFSAKTFQTEDGINYYTLRIVNREPELTGGVITDAQANISPETTAPVVNMQMDSEGALEWARITGANVGERCAIVLDGMVYSAPVINTKISGGRSVIEGMADLDEAKLLEIVLKAGALPAPVDIIEERTVGPSLGQDSISQGLNSTVIGLALVAVFMIVYYRKSGTIADIALIFTILFIMGILAGFQATLTLPGIAGIILTIGMAVDANILIFERIKEELENGKTIRAAVDSGYSNSYSAIFDSNITTFFTAIILYQFGSGPIQGFALTLMIGIISSLFAALVITRLIFDYLIFKGAKINIGTRKHFLSDINIDFLSKRKTAYIISAVLMVLGLISLVTRGVELGIDFKGGTEIALEFEQPVEINEIRNQVSGIGIGNVEVKTFGGETGILLRTELQQIPADVFPNVISSIERGIDRILPNVERNLVDSTSTSVTYMFANPDTTDIVTEKLFSAGFQTSEVSLEPENTQMVVRVGIADWVEESLRELHPDNRFDVLKEEQVGPKIGEELKMDAVIAIVLSLLVILFYLSFRFKFIFASGAVAALFHDVLITLGVFSLLYGMVSFLNLEITINVVAAFLTLVGYSINDTVVVFDRIRENIMIHKTANLDDNINKGVNSTLRRTIITSLTTLFVVTVLLIFGGEVLRGFAFTLFFGIIIGTYSSIFVASPFVYEYATKSKKKIEF